MENGKVSPVKKDDDQKNGATKNENINSANDVTAKKSRQTNKIHVRGRKY